VIPQSEGGTPDGKDNDCDGKIDEGLSAKVVTFAGPPLPFERVADGMGSNARISSISSMALGADGTVFFADGAFLRQMSPNGQVLTLAGEIAGFADGIGKSAKMNAPRGLVYLSEGHLLFADRGNHRIRRLERPSNQVVTMAGSGGCQTSSGTNCYRDGDASQAQFFNPSGVAVDSAGVVYIADTGNHRIRRLDLNNQVTTFSGTGTRGSTDGDGNQAQFNQPTDIVFHTDNSFYILDAQGRSIRRMTLQGVVSTYMNFNRGFLAFAFRAEGDIFLISSYSLERLDSNKNISVVAGNPQGRGFWDGEAKKALFSGLSSLAIRPDGGILLGDSGSRRIRLLTTQAQVASLAGDAEAGWRDGAPTQALFYDPTGIVSDGVGGFFVSDTQNHLIRRIDAQGNVTTLAGSLEKGFEDGLGQEARFNSPRGLVWSAGFLYIADTENNAIRRMDAQGRVTTFAGSGQDGASNGQGTEAEFSQPTALAVDNQGRIYVADTGNYLIRRIDTQGNVTTFSGSGEYGQEDGAAQKAEFSSPVSLAFSPSGELYVGENDFQYASLRKISATGAVTTLSKREEANEREIGAVSTVYLSPRGLVFAPNGELFLSDERLSVIRKLDTQGQISLVAGSSFGFLDGLALLSEFHEPSGLALTSQGHLLIVDTWNHRIRRYEP
jgi:sugar lactone lactonase YvrE